MTKKGKGKARTKVQREEEKSIAEVASKQQLKRDILLLKRLPRDFRDIDPGSKSWEAFGRITGRCEEMDAWERGTVLCLVQPSEAETRVLGPALYVYPVPTKLDQGNWLPIIEAGNNKHMLNCSWIYLPEEEHKVIVALNILLSRFEYNIRAKGQILSERTGHPIGIVY